MSFDTDSGKVVEETLSGRPLKGRIDKIDGERIDFHIVIPGTPDMDIVWDGKKKTLTTVPIPGNMSRDRTVVECGLRYRIEIHAVALRLDVTHDGCYRDYKPIVECAEGVKHGANRILRHRFRAALKRSCALGSFDCSFLRHLAV